MLPNQFARKQFLYLAVLQNLRLFHLNRKVKEMPDKRGRDIFSQLTPVTFRLIYHRKKFFQAYRVKKQKNRHLPNNDAPWNAKRRQDNSSNIRLTEVVKVVGSVIKIFTDHSRTVAIIGKTSLYRQPEIKNFAFWWLFLLKKYKKVVY